jgi:hypothetical protein
MKKLLIILPRGEAIKNFVYSGITDALRESYKIVFFSVVPNPKIKSYLATKCDAFYPLDETIKTNNFSKEVKEILQLAHLINLNSVTGNLKIVKDDLASKKSFTSKLIRKLRKLIASLFVTDSKLIWLTRFFEKSNYNNSQVIYYQKLVAKIQPDLVFNASHIHNLLSLNLMYAVKKLKINTAAFLFSWDNLTSQGRILPAYDYLYTWNQKIKEDVLRYYPTFNEKNVFVTGTPQFDFHFDKQHIDSKKDLYQFLGIESQKKIVLYSTGMVYYTPKEYVHVQEIEKVLKKIDPNLQLVVRIYAKDDNSVYYQLREENKNIIIPDHYWELNHLTPTIKDLKLFNSLLNHCVIGINVASTVSLELAILDKPIINIAYNPPGENVYPNDYEKIYDFDHYKPIVESGAVTLAKSLIDLERQIKKHLEFPETNASKRKILVEDFFGKELKADRKEVFKNVFHQILKDG